MKKEKQTTRMLAMLSLLAAMGLHAQSSFQPISIPNSAYLSGTTKLVINYPNAAFVGGLSDSTLTATFGTGGPYFLPMGASPPEATQPGSWFLPPYSESSTPGTLLYYSDAYLPGRSLYITFTKPLQTFGVEIEVELWNVTSPITATFYNGLTPLGSITQTIGGYQGGRLFAAHTDTAQFNSVVIYDPSSPSGYMLGQFRYAVVPEPATAAFIVLGSCLFIWRSRSRTRN